MLILMKKIAEIMMGGEGFRSQVSGQGGDSPPYTLYRFCINKKTAVGIISNSRFIGMLFYRH